MKGFQGSGHRRPTTQDDYAAQKWEFMQATLSRASEIEMLFRKSRRPLFRSHLCLFMPRPVSAF
jgi:hypothetical protein